MCNRLNDLKQRSRVHAQKQIPKEINVDRLFDIDLDESIWEDAGLDLDEGDIAPAWLADNATREGIKAVQMFDRAGEEIVRLCYEFNSLALWLMEELEATQCAQLQSKGGYPWFSTYCIVSNPLLL